MCLLPFDVEPDFLLIQADWAHTIATCPERAAPITSAQLLILMKEAERQLTFEKPVGSKNSVYDSEWQDYAIFRYAKG